MKKRVLFWVFFIGGVYLIVMLARDLWQVVSSRQRVEDAWHQVEELTAGKQVLQRQLEWVETDEFVEREAREKLMLGLPGERVVLLPQIGSRSGVLRETQQEAVILVPWQQWWKLFVY